MNFCLKVISSFARHYKTGEPLADSTVQDMCAAKHLFAASVSGSFLYGSLYWCMCVNIYVYVCIYVYVYTHTHTHTHTHTFVCVKLVGSRAGTMGHMGAGKGVMIVPAVIVVSLWFSSFFGLPSLHAWWMHSVQPWWPSVRCLPWEGETGRWVPAFLGKSC